MARAKCNFHAKDTVNFWNAGYSFFFIPLPPTYIKDVLVRACNPQGRGFDALSNTTSSLNAIASCKGELALVAN